jgi:hypothetical protein
MQHGLHDIYCSAQHDQCSLIIHTFWLHGVVGADLRPDNLVKTHYFLMIFKVLVLHGLSIWFASLWLCVLQQGAAALT